MPSALGEWRSEVTLGGTFWDQTILKLVGKPRCLSLALLPLQKL